MFHVDDMARGYGFYVEALGFEKEWEWRHEPGFPAAASVAKSPFRVFLTEHPESAPGALALFYLDSPGDVDRWADVVTGGGVAIDFGPVDQPWGLREMQITDPDSNKLRIVADNDGQ